MIVKTDGLFAALHKTQSSLHLEYLEEDVVEVGGDVDALDGGALGGGVQAADVQAGVGEVLGVTQLRRVIVRIPGHYSCQPTFSLFKAPNIDLATVVRSHSWSTVPTIPVTVLVWPLSAA